MLVEWESNTPWMFFFSLYFINTFRPDELNIEVETLFIHVYELVKLRDKTSAFQQLIWI